MSKILNAYGNFWRNYARFEGRTSRADFWLTFLANAVLVTATYILFYICFMATYDLNMLFIGFGILVVYNIATFIPSLALCVRRLHDIGKAGTAIFFALIPFVGAIMLLVWYCNAAEPVRNVFGEPIACKSKFAHRQYASATAVTTGVPSAPFLDVKARDKLVACPNCGSVGTGAFCPDCGTRMK